jgi:hypothetical protein
MANVSNGDSPSLHIVLERVDPSRNIARYYVLSIEPTLFVKHTLIRRWGRIGCLALLWQIKSSERILTAGRLGDLESRRRGGLGRGS